ncbi:MAG: N-acetyltransferase [Humibacillus sp.]|nr:N-acetyltransferase [Humibacillus sp.]MDN5779584.1 N-acetyltransferase [Humibacillus sp.]
MAVDVRILETADVDESASLGSGTTVWHLAQVREKATIGSGCIIGRGAYVDVGVRVGTNCKVQNHALVYAPAHLGDGVFIGPAACLTNDSYPRAVSPEGERLEDDDWERRGVRVDDGAAVGARAVVLGGVRIGAWAMVAAGAVVVRDVPAYALVAGVPARQIGWVDRRGRRTDSPPDVADGAPPRAVT